MVADVLGPALGALMAEKEVAVVGLDGTDEGAREHLIPLEAALRLIVGRFRRRCLTGGGRDAGVGGGGVGGGRVHGGEGLGAAKMAEVGEAKEPCPRSRRGLTSRST